MEKANSQNHNSAKAPYDSMGMHEFYEKFGTEYSYYKYLEGEYDDILARRSLVENEEASIRDSAVGNESENLLVPPPGGDPDTKPKKELSTEKIDKLSSKIETGDTNVPDDIQVKYHVPRRLLKKYWTSYYADAFARQGLMNSQGQAVTYQSAFDEGLIFRRDWRDNTVYIPKTPREMAPLNWQAEDEQVVAGDAQDVIDEQATQENKIATVENEGNVEEKVTPIGPVLDQEGTTQNGAEAEVADIEEQNVIIEGVDTLPTEGESAVVEPPKRRELHPDISWKTPLTTEQKEKYNWDFALEEMKAISPELGSTTRAQWTRKALSNGWVPGEEPPPSIHDIEVEAEGDVLAVTAYSYDEAYGAMKEDGYDGIWYWKTPLGGSKGSKNQQIGSVSKYNRENAYYSDELVKMLWWVAGPEETRHLKDGAIADGRIGDNFNWLVRKAQEVVYDEGEYIPTGMLTPESMEKIEARWKEMAQAETKFVEEKRNMYAYPIDKPNLEEGKIGGVNFRLTPHHPESGQPSEEQFNLEQNIPYGTPMKILEREEADPENGWLHVELPDGRKGYVKGYLVRKKESTRDFGDAFLYEVNSADFADYDEFKKFREGYATGAKIAAKFYNDVGDETDYLRRILEYNQDNPAVNLPEDIRDKPLDELTQKDLARLEVWEGYNIWLPTPRVMYEDNLKDELKDGDGSFREFWQDQGALSTFEKEEQLKRDKIKFDENREKISQIDDYYINKIEELTGVSWGEFLLTILSPVAGAVDSYVDSVEWDNLNDTMLEKYGISADGVLKTLEYFRDLALEEAYDMVDRVEEFCSQERKRLSNDKYKQDLHNYLKSFSDEHHEADLMRAEAIFKFFEKRQDRSGGAKFADSAFEYLSNTNMVFSDYEYMESFYDNDDLEGLANYLEKKGAGYAAGFISAYEYTDVVQDYIVHSTITPGMPIVVKDVLADYPELTEAEEKDAATNAERLKRADEFPILRDPELDWRGLSNTGDADFMETFIRMHLANRESNARETRSNLRSDPNMVWELKPVLETTMVKHNIPKESKLGELILDKIEDTDRHNTMVSIGLAVVGLALAVAGFFTGGATWAGLAIIIAGVGVSTYDLIREIEHYNFHSAASNSGVGDIMNMSDVDPSVWGIVFAVLGLGLDIVDLFKAGGKVIKALSKLGDATITDPAVAQKAFKEMYDEIRLKNPDMAMSEEDFIAKMMDSWNESSSLGKNVEAVKELFKGTRLEGASDAVALPFARMHKIDPELTESFLKMFSDDSMSLMVFARHINEAPELARTYVRLGKALEFDGWGGWMKHGYMHDTFRHLATDGQRNLDILPEVVAAIEKSGLDDPKLVNEVFKYRGLQKVLIAEGADEMSKLWKAYEASELAKAERLGNFYTPKPFYKYVEEQNIPSFKMSVDDIAIAARGEALAKFNEASTELSNALRQVAGMGVPLTTEVINALIKKIRYGLKLAIYKGGDFRAWISKLLADQHYFKPLTDEEYAKIWQRMVRENADEVARDMVLSGFRFQDEIADTVATILSKGDIDPGQLRHIFENAARQSDFNPTTFADSLKMLTDQRPAGWEKVMSDLADPQLSSGAQKFLNGAADTAKVGNAPLKIDGYDEAMDAFKAENRVTSETSQTVDEAEVVVPPPRTDDLPVQLNNYKPLRDRITAIQSQIGNTASYAFRKGFLDICTGPVLKRMQDVMGDDALVRFAQTMAENKALRQMFNADPHMIDVFVLAYKNDEIITSATELRKFADAVSNVKGNVPTAKWDDFVGDFAGDAGAIGKFEAEPDLITGWKRFKDSPLRTNMAYLEYIQSLPKSWKIEVTNGITKILDGKGNELAELSEDMIKAKGGNKADGDWNKLLNKPPMKSQTYLVDNYTYHVDEYGRVNRVTGTLEDIERGRLTSQQTGSVTLKDGTVGEDQGGHLIAQILNGPGEQINYLPQLATLNQGAWKDMEMLWKNALREVPPKEVRVDIRPIFEGSSQRPVAFEVDYWLDGIKKSEYFDN